MTDAIQPDDQKISTKSEVDRMVAEVESGARNAAGVAGGIVVAITFMWSLFQLYNASTLPFWLAENTGLNTVLNNQETRQIHLAFSLVLAMLAYPLFKSSTRTQIPWFDWVLAIVAACTCLYLFYFKNDIAGRAGLPTTADIVISAVGMIRGFRCHHFPVCLIWFSAGEGGCRKLLHKTCIRVARALSRWSGEGCCGCLCVVGFVFRFIDCERGDNRNFHYPANETNWV